MKFLPIAQLIVLILILMTLNSNLISTGVSSVLSLFQSNPVPAKADVPRKRKSA